MSDLITNTINSPARMMELALDKGTDLSQLEKLLDLQEKFEKNEARKAYHKAMAAFKKEPLSIKKDQQAGYYNKKSQFVGYNWASLGNVIEVASPALAAHDLSATWNIQQANNAVTVTCTITHALGHAESTSMTAPPDASGNKNVIQAIASTVSYLERYTFLASIGQATSDQEIDDGQGHSAPGSAKNNNGSAGNNNRDPKSLITKGEYNNLISLLESKNRKHEVVIGYFKQQDPDWYVSDLTGLVFSEYEVCLTLINEEK